jgi:hypothetical protein
MADPYQGESAATTYLMVAVRLGGVFVLIVGLFAGFKVIKEAWNLYYYPHTIERFATAIENGSNLDMALAPITSSVLPGKTGKQKSAAKSKSENFKLSYFLAWVIVILLLMLIGRLALVAIRTGGELALYDLQVKRFARILIKEATKSPNNKSRSPDSWKDPRS